MMKNEFKAAPQIKTIQFGLKPIGSTSQNIKEYISYDKQRKDNYEIAKGILDRYARLVVNKATQAIAEENMTPTYDAIIAAFNIMNEDNTKENRVKYTRLIEDYKKYIAKKVEEYAGEYQLNKQQANLFIEKKSCLLANADKINLTEKEREIILSYNKFTRYFEKYFVNLSTRISGTAKGSIADRIIENIEIYCKNNQKIETIKENHQELYNMIYSNVEQMKIGHTMYQQGVDDYNKIIGDTKNSGINSIINIYKQKEKVNAPLLKTLYKIPICSENKQVTVDKIENEDELKKVILDSLEIVSKLIEFGKSFLKKLPDQNKKNIYIKENALASLSLIIYKKWNTLQIETKNYCELHAIKYNDSLSLELIQSVIEHSEAEPNCTIINAIKKMLSESVNIDIDSIRELAKENNILNHKIEIKEFYESLLNLRKTLKIFNLDKDENELIVEIENLQESMDYINTVYNMIRNFCTKNPTQVTKWPLFFNKSTFLSSFDSDKFSEGTTLATILRKDGLFYVLIANPSYSNKLENCAYTEDGEYAQLKYKQLTGVNKMFPKCFLSKAGEQVYKPSDEIIKISKEKLYTKEANNKEALTKWIAFCIESFKKNEDWCKNFNPKFRKPEEYESANQFYTEIENSLIHMDFSKRISEEYLNQAIEQKKVFLFQIYNMDFSPYHTGKDSIYTKILKELFSDDNLRKLNDTNDTALKLASGGSEILFRPAAIPYRETHPANQPIKNKNPLNPKKESVFTYALCKDKRYMFDSLRLSLAVQIGYRNADVYQYELNQKVNKYVLENKLNILTIRAAEGHLLYYIVNDHAGNILEEGSLNIIKTKHDDKIIETDYKNILTQRENEINEAKQKWDYSKDIKKIKTGYMSAAINQIVELQQKYNSIIFVEDYNGSFIRGRMKNMKSIYQQFQKALLQKYSCFVAHGAKYADAIQLACPVSSFEQMKGQSGIVYFINPSYTSKADPTTGFVNQFSFIYENMKKAKATIEKISNVEYCNENKEFEITLNEKAFGISKENIKWVLHTSGERKIYQNNKNIEYNCTNELKTLLFNYHIYEWKDIKDATLNKAFYEKFFEIMRVLLALHYYDSDMQDEYTLSPVSHANERLDTRKNKQLKNTAAVKTLTLYLKGRRELERIDEEKMLIQKVEKGKYIDNWIEYLKTANLYPNK